MKKTTIISVMAVLWPKTNEDKGARIKDQPPRYALGVCYPVVKVCVTMLLIFGLFIPTIWAQNTPVKPLMVGDKVPASFWEQKYTIYQDGKTTTQTLAQYKGKLLILDFWATWCGACISAMPKMDSIQKQMKDSVIILPTTYETTKVTASFLASNSITKPLNLKTLVANPSLYIMFPHQLLPHYVWINADGYIENTTSAAQVNILNIRSVITNAEHKISSKIDIDTDKPLFLKLELLKDQQVMGDAILIKGRYDGLPFGSHQIYSKTTNQTIGKTISNRPLLAIFENCAYDLFKDIGLRYTPSQLRLEQTDTVGLNSLFTLSVYQPNHTKLHLASAMLLHLNSFSGYMATLEKREETCWVLTHQGNSSLLKTKGGKATNRLFKGLTIGHLVNKPISSLVDAINTEFYREVKYHVVNETAIEGPIDLSLGPVKNLSELQNELRSYGLNLQQKKRLIDVFVIKPTI